MKELITDANLQIVSQPVEGEVEYNPGVTIQSMDLSHVSLVSAEISMEAFSVFGSKFPRLQIGINLNHLSKVLAFADDDDRVVMM